MADLLPAARRLARRVVDFIEWMGAAKAPIQAVFEIALLSDTGEEAKLARRGPRFYAEAPGGAAFRFGLRGDLELVAEGPAEGVETLIEVIDPIFRAYEVRAPRLAGALRLIEAEGLRVYKEAQKLLLSSGRYVLKEEERGLKFAWTIEDGEGFLELATPRVRVMAHEHLGAKGMVRVPLSPRGLEEILAGEDLPLLGDLQQALLEEFGIVKA